jgi:pimeloyl-ACP methyl ester carboxylesterase
MRHSADVANAVSTDESGKPVIKKLPVTVLVNGLSNDAFQWSGLNESLVAPDRALVAWDFRGHGASDDPKNLSTVTIAGVADDLEQVLCDISARGLADTEKVTLVAYSMGCQVALEWCRLHARYARASRSFWERRDARWTPRVSYRK